MKYVGPQEHTLPPSPFQVTERSADEFSVCFLCCMIACSVHLIASGCYYRAFLMDYTLMRALKDHREGSCPNIAFGVS